MMVQLSSLPSVELIAAASTSRLSDECHSPSEACARVSCVFIVSGEFQPAVSLLRQLSREVFSINLAVVSTSMQCVRRSLITFLLNAFTKLEMPKTSTKHEITCSGIVPPAKTAFFLSAVPSHQITGLEWYRQTLRHCGNLQQAKLQRFAFQDGHDITSHVTSHVSCCFSIMGSRR